MKSLAIIGTGIAGMACGYYLQNEYALTVYEKNDYVGGHTHAVDVEEDARFIPIDTGFIVYNEVNYPNLTTLFQELGVATQPSDMSFSVQHQPTGLEFCGSGISGLFAQRKNLFHPPFWLLLSDINRFNKECPEVLTDPRFAQMTIEDYVRVRGFSKDLLDKYLIPMSSAVWSTPSDVMLKFPVMTLVRFFKNHGFLGLNTQYPWRTVTGTSRQYRNKITEGYGKNIRVGHGVVRVERQENQAAVTEGSGETATYDRVVIATHGDEALKLLANPSPLEKELLSKFRYQKNMALLHTDESVMPRTRRAWSSWNWWTGADARGQIKSTTIYWMNSLQKVSQKKNYFLSINDAGQVRPEHKLREIEYEHPIFSVESTKAQLRLPELNAKGPLYFCGSYFRYGFHEDALMSALDVVQELKGKGE